MKLWLQTSSTLMCNGLAQLQLGQELHLPTESLNNSPGHHRHSQQAALEQPPPEWTPLTKTTPCPAPPQATSEAKQDVSWGTTEWGGSHGDLPLDVGVLSSPKRQEQSVTLHSLT